MAASHSCSVAVGALLYGNAILFKLLVNVKHLLLGRCQCVLEAFHHAHRQYHVAVFMWFITPTNLSAIAQIRLAFSCTLTVVCC